MAKLDLICKPLTTILRRTYDVSHLDLLCSAALVYTTRQRLLSKSLLRGGMPP